MNTVGQLASGIWDDLSQPQNPSVAYISGWLGSDRGIGKLNALLNTQFIIDYSGAYTGQTYDAGGYQATYQPGDFYQTLGNVEAAIYAEVYKGDYYDKRIRDVLNGILDAGADPSLDWSALDEGDTKVERSNRSELLKTYRGLAQDARADLQKLVGYYRSNLSGPRAVDISEPSLQSNYVYISWPYRRLGQ